jgi:hypothetical protein
MKISPGQSPGTLVEPPSPPANRVKSERDSVSSAGAPPVEKTAVAEGTLPVAPLQRQTDVTYRRDNNGRFYYAVSDAKSGQEILEVPPKALRDVGQGIEDYLKEQQTKASPHVEVKA